MLDHHKIKVALIDYGLGNILCIQRAFEHCGASVTVLSQPCSPKAFTHIVLPGVGAFYSGMKNLISLGFVDFISEAIQHAMPFMGICLGMQLLYKSGTEGGYSEGLNIFDGKIVQIPKYDINNKRVKLPHIGWNQLTLCDLKSPITNGLNKNNYVYFDHAYYATISNLDILIAETEHETIKIAALVQHKNIVGCQFHPEKSGETGLKVIENFCKLSISF